MESSLNPARLFKYIKVENKVYSSLNKH